MYTLTAHGYTIGLIASSKAQIKKWISHSFARTKAGWLTGKITKVTAWPMHITTVYDVSKEMQEIEEFIAAHSEIWYNGERINL